MKYDYKDIVAQTTHLSILMTIFILIESLCPSHIKTISNPSYLLSAEFGEDDEDVVADAGNNADLYPQPIRRAQN